MALPYGYSSDDFRDASSLRDAVDVGAVKPGGGGLAFDPFSLLAGPIGGGGFSAQGGDAEATAIAEQTVSQHTGDFAPVFGGASSGQTLAQSLVPMAALLMVGFLAVQMLRGK